MQQQILQTRIHSKQQFRFGLSGGVDDPAAPNCERIDIYEAADRVRRCVPPIVRPDDDGGTIVVSANAALGCVAAYRDDYRRDLPNAARQQQ